MKTCLCLGAVGLLALALTTFASAAWGALLAMNLRTSPGVPWAAMVMAGLLWLAWQYAGGTVKFRKVRIRAL